MRLMPPSNPKVYPGICLPTSLLTRVYASQPPYMPPITPYVHPVHPMYTLCTPCAPYAHP